MVRRQHEMIRTSIDDRLKICANTNGTFLPGNVIHSATKLEIDRWLERGFIKHEGKLLVLTSKGFHHVGTTHFKI